MPRLFVANISFSTKEEDLLAVFSPFGTVECVEITTDRHRDVPRVCVCTDVRRRECPPCYLKTPRRSLPRPYAHSGRVATQTSGECRWISAP